VRIRNLRFYYIYYDQLFGGLIKYVTE